MYISLYLNLEDISNEPELSQGGHGRRGSKPAGRLFQSAADGALDSRQREAVARLGEADMEIAAARRDVRLKVHEG